MEIDEGAKIVEFVVPYFGIPHEQEVVNIAFSLDGQQFFPARRTSLSHTSSSTTLGTTTESHNQLSFRYHSPINAGQV